MPTRRDALCALGTVPFLAFSKSGSSQTFPSGLQERAATKFAGARGCGITRLREPISILSKVEHSGFAELDRNVQSETQALGYAFHVHPIFSFYNDGTECPQALSIPSGSLTDVLMGINLVSQERNRSPVGWETAIIGIMAHEWAHAFQYLVGLQELMYLWETHADFLAGWYLGTKQGLGVKGIQIDEFAKSLYERGSGKGFFDPNDYGSSKLRVAAMRRGFQVGMEHARPGHRPDVDIAAALGYAFVQSLAS